ncbi:hypothetical protein GTS_41040 [Gandjariella thermophila]|uniref:Uncharacterized protein n=1 Tax=Gandjariella thermophila TaxID=1931992 RepID=A0A4D4J751_9PSEU|nr:hypothetical protein GTS_41040 [Gandjariella thermophila]
MGAALPGVPRPVGAIRLAGWLLLTLNAQRAIAAAPVGLYRSLTAVSGDADRPATEYSETGLPHRSTGTVLGWLPDRGPKKEVEGDVN